jgi:hypothetical protein
MGNGWLAVLTIAVAVLGVGRLTRVIVHDDFPPAVWWRIKWSTWTHDGPWSKLFLCWWCLSFWIALICVGWFLLIPGSVFFLWSWWIFWGSLALSYVAAMIIVRDEPGNDE